MQKNPDLIAQPLNSVQELNQRLQETIKVQTKLCTDTKTLEKDTDETQGKITEINEQKIPKRMHESLKILLKFVQVAVALNLGASK